MSAEGGESGEQLRLLDNEALPVLPRPAAPVVPAPPPEPLAWPARIRAALVEQPESAVPLAEEALRTFPGDGELLLLAVLAALVAEHPDRALSYLKRFYKRYQPTRATTLLTAIASAQQGRARQAWELLEPKGLLLRWQARLCFVGGRAMEPWLNEQLARIEREHARLKRGAARSSRKAAPRAAPVTSSGAGGGAIAASAGARDDVRRAVRARQCGGAARR